MEEYAVAPVYDYLLDPFVRMSRIKILELCRKYDYATILDVCCGTGDQLKLLGKNGFRVSGVDLSEKMLEVSKRGEFNPQCRLEDASDMTYPDDSFDAAMTTFALHEKSAETSRAIVEEMLRVVKPGGHLILTDFRLSEETFFIAGAMVHAIERFAGGEHYRNFRSYNEAGGIPSILTGLPLELGERIPVGMGSVTIDLYHAV